MKNLFLLLAVLLFAPPCMAADKAGIKLLSQNYTFSQPSGPTAQITSVQPKGTVTPPLDIEKGFAISMTVELSPFSNTVDVLSIPGVIDVKLHQWNPEDRIRQNYPANRMADGTVPVMEASIHLVQPAGEHKEETMTIGFPLAELPNPWQKHDVVINFAGPTFTIYVDGKLMDNDFALGYPKKEAFASWSANPKIVSKATFSSPALKATRSQEGQDKVVGFQFFTPQWHNAWVGDVAACWHKGRYHLFYLFDRRGHRSKFGKGGHYFEHLSTTDFVHWTEHEAAVPIDQQWETLGTGTPFVYDGKLCLAYGMHTTRIYPREKTVLPEQWDFINKYSYSKCINMDTLKYAIPDGASYAVSDDDIHFRKSHLLIHPCENPTIFTDEKGQLSMLANYGARGYWIAPQLNGGWHCISEDFPPGGDCTFIMHWNDYDYIVGGFTRQWMKRADEPIDKYQDLVAQGVDFYDGMSVPALTTIDGGRCVEAGWLQVGEHWGSVLVLHELIQDSDGRIGSKWMNEVTPRFANSRQWNGKKAQNIGIEATMTELSFRVKPTADGKVSVILKGDKPDETCHWDLDLAKKCAQYGKPDKDGKVPASKTLREGGQPQRGVDYAVDHLSGLDDTFPVRMMIYQSDKLGGCIIDTEIAGKRTMLSCRLDLRPTQVAVTSQAAKVSNVTTAW